MRRATEPSEREGYCHGCHSYARRVALSRYRCAACASREGSPR
jgi:hypothetical protein